MLNRSAVKVSLEEPRKKFLEMIAFLRNFGTRAVHLVHVAPGGSAKHLQKARDQLGEIGREVAEFGFEVQTHFSKGHAPSAFIGVAESQEVDYVSIFWVPKPVLRNALLGSIDADILRLSNLPVFIHNTKLFQSVVALESVLYATDFTYTDCAVMPYLVDSRFKAQKLYLLHVGDRAPDPATENRRKQQVLENLERLARECSHAYEEVEVIETIGLARREIVKQAAAHNVDLIVAGKSQDVSPVGQIIGSTAEILPHRAKCSVFIIPGVCSLTRPVEGDAARSRGQ